MCVCLCGGVLFLASITVRTVSKGEHQELPSDVKPSRLPSAGNGASKGAGDLCQYMPVLTLAEQLAGNKQRSGEGDEV